MSQSHICEVVRVRTRMCSLALLLPLVIACSDRVLPSGLESEPVDVSPHVTAQAAVSLNSSGQFESAFLSQPSEGISEAKAMELARGVLRQFGTMFSPFIEEQAGRKVDFSALVPEKRVLFAETPYEPAATSAPIPVRAGIGPFYIVRFRDHRGPAVAVAVSTYTSDFKVVDGQLKWPLRHGNQFRFAGIPATAHIGLPLPPETAAVNVASATGARISAPPVFVRQGLWAPPFVGAWRVQLDRDVQVVRADDGSAMSTREVYVRGDGTIAAPSGEREVDQRRARIGSQDYTVSAYPRADLGRKLVDVALAQGG